MFALLLFLLAACGTAGPLGVVGQGPDEANIVIVASPSDAQVSFNDAAVVPLASGPGVGAAGSAGAHYFMAQPGNYRATIEASGYAPYTADIDVPDSGVVGINVHIDDSGTHQTSLAVNAGPNRTVNLNQNVDLAGSVESGGADTPFSVMWSVDKSSGIVTFADPTIAETAVSFENPGVYVLRMTADLGDFAISNVVEIKVAPFAGTIYYVDTKGSDKNPGTSKTLPFRTLRRAGQAVRAGDIIRVRGGIYHEYNDKTASVGLPATSFTTSGTTADPIVIESEPGEWAVFDGSLWPDGTPIDVANLNTVPQRPVLLYLAVDHYVVRNLEFRRSAGTGVATSSDLLGARGSYNAFVNLKLHHNHSNGLATSGSTVPTEGNLAEFVESHNNGSIRNGGNSADGIKMSHTSTSTIRYSKVYKNSDDGIDFIGSVDMRVHHTSAWLNGYFYPSDDNDPFSTRGQTVAPTGDGNGFKMAGASSGANSGNTGTFNIAWGNHNFGFTHNSGGGVRLFNNTAYDNVTGGFAARCYHTNVLRNNLSVANSDLIGSSGNICPNGEMVDTRYNSWDLGVTHPGLLSTDPTSPLFLQPARNGGVIDKGRDIGLPFTGAAPDLGALELGLASESDAGGSPQFANVQR